MALVRLEAPCPKPLGLAVERRARDAQPEGNLEEGERAVAEVVRSATRGRGGPIEARLNLVFRCFCYFNDVSF